jgi:hypothetical protein
MVNVHGFVYTVGVNHDTLLQIGFSKQSVLYTHSVGFGIAYPRMQGNARAYKSGMSDEFRFPRFFYVVLGE